MPEIKKIVINTGPIIALSAALGDIKILKKLYSEIIAPYEVVREILVGGSTGFAAEEFKKSGWISKQKMPTIIPAHLSRIRNPVNSSTDSGAIVHLLYQNPKLSANS